MRSASPASHALGWIYLTALLSSAFLTWKRFPTIAYGLLYFVVASIPAGNFIPNFNGPIYDAYVTIPSIGLVIPDLKGKLDGISIRVPTPNVSVVDFKFVAKKATTKEEINAAIKAAADGPLKTILGYTNAPNVSLDFNHDPRSSIFHNDQTKVMEGKFCSVLSWYDNEWGFSNRMADTAVAMAKLI